ncbi:MAG: hypothetical protein EOP14_00110 [Pseudomonas sp.]|nr:MAG: hypothetical protein EOP14_00110 [Pseudomonas sp.]
MTIRIIDDEICLTRAEHDAYLAQWNALAAQTRCCVHFEGWVRMQREGEAWARSESNRRNLAAKPEDEGMRVWG